MRVLLQTEFAASKKEPLGEVFARIRAAFLDAQMGAPVIQFALSDSPIAGGVSSVDRVLKRYPTMQRYYTETPLMPTLPPSRRLTNRQDSGAPIDPEMLHAILTGVPKSFPFHNVVVTFTAAVFGQGAFQGILGEVTPGVVLGDSWWVNGRSRSMSAFTFVEAEVTGKKLPPLPGAVATLFAAIGKAKKTKQFPLPGENPSLPHAAKPEVLAAVREAVSKYRAQFPEILARIPFPHDLPSSQEALRATPPATVTGPKKPALVHAFGPMGYRCTGESGVFTLRRRTSGNLILEISLDVGTWSRSLTANFSVKGLGFSVPLHIPVSRQAGPAQYPIGDAARWQQLVDNIHAVVTELEQSYVPTIEAAAGRSPEWFNPES